MQPGDQSALTAYVQAQAPRYGLDPRAVLAVAAQEGLGGGIGDNGTSFGPWQLHQGGAYPRSAPQSPPTAANAWAWSPAGVDYALGRMGSVAGGLRGQAAVRAIVYRFERPANPTPEYQAAVNAYYRAGPIRVGSGDAGGGGPVVGAVTGAAGGVAGAAGGIASGVEGTVHLLGELTDPHFWLRALQVVGGGLLVLLGLYLLGREAGVVDKAQGAVGTAASVIPVERAAAAAGRANTARKARAVQRSRRRELDARYGREAPF